MESQRDCVLTINPGSGSTKFGVFSRSGAEFIRIIEHRDEDLVRLRAKPLLVRAEHRSGEIRRELEAAGYLRSEAGACRFAAVAARGGLLPPLPSGTYLVDQVMLEELRQELRGIHASNLGAFLAHNFARELGLEGYIVDPVTVDEWQDCARFTGSPLVTRTSIGHALNIKATAKRFARAQGKPYRDLRLIVAHLGSGITVSAHLNARMIDSNSIEEGPFGPDRTGGLPVRSLIKLCFNGGFTQTEIDRHVFGEGGFFAYLGTRDLRQIEQRMEEGDAKATAVFEALVYQIAKETGAMAMVLQGKVNAVLLTGGMAHSARMVQSLQNYVNWVAPVHVYPGEDELQALADGVFRVLDGEETAKRLEEVAKMG